MREEFYRRSANGEGQVMSYRWKAATPKAIVQIIHDKSEYAGRYDRLAEALADAGYEVLANDLVGHGMSKQGHRGAFSNGESALEYLVQDTVSLFEFAEAETGSLPKVLIGFGLGELIAERCAAAEPDLSVLILAECIKKPAGIAAIRMSIRNQIRRHGFTSISESVHHMMFQTGKKPAPEGERDFYWLSTVQEEISRYARDEDCGFPLAASAYRDMLDAFREMRTEEGASGIPDIPIYVLAGAEDQLGMCGGTPRELCLLLSSTGHHQVAMRLYSSAYHDLLHDFCAEDVVEDIRSFLDREIGRERA
ncbi:MAG: alpha/beta hydrolase [Mogibacterium sp.]|nr:alpha/beta hydrolase [Mogibacterium sp.]